MNTTYRQRERGAISGGTVAAIILGVFTAAFAGLAIWAFLNYNEQKTDVDGKIALAESAAKKKQSDEDAKYYDDLLQKPYTEFVGPDDYGRLTFMYPKTWSSYIAKDVTKGGTFEAYLNPGTVPPVSNTQPFALRVTISETDYDKTLASYESLIKKGDLKSSTTSSNGQSGTRLDGSFSKNIRGAAVFYKIRDKTLVIQTDVDSSDIKSKFEEIIKTIKFNT